MLSKNLIELKSFKWVGSSASRAIQGLNGRDKLNRDSSSADLQFKSCKLRTRCNYANGGYTMFQSTNGYLNMYSSLSGWSKFWLYGKYSQSNYFAPQVNWDTDSSEETHASTQVSDLTDFSLISTFSTTESIAQLSDDESSPRGPEQD